MHSQHPLGRQDSPLPLTFPSALSPTPISSFPLSLWGPGAHGWEGRSHLRSRAVCPFHRSVCPFSSYQPHSYFKKSIGNCHPQQGLSFSRERVAVGTGHLLCAQNMLDPMQKAEQTWPPALEESQRENLVSKSELLGVGIRFRLHFLVSVCRLLRVCQTVCSRNVSAFISA